MSSPFAQAYDFMLAFAVIQPQWDLMLVFLFLLQFFSYCRCGGGEGRGEVGGRAADVVGVMAAVVVSVN
jgi:hypothetical protein